MLFKFLKNILKDLVENHLGSVFSFLICGGIFFMIMGGILYDFELIKQAEILAVMGGVLIGIFIGILLYITLLGFLRYLHDIWKETKEEKKNESK